MSSLAENVLFVQNRRKFRPLLLVESCAINYRVNIWGRRIRDKLPLWSFNFHLDGWFFQVNAWSPETCSFLDLWFGKLKLGPLPLRARSALCIPQNFARLRDESGWSCEKEPAGASPREYAWDPHSHGERTAEKARGGGCFARKRSPFEPRSNPSGILC